MKLAKLLWTCCAVLCVAPAFAQPVNDNCASATPVVENVATAFTLVDATNEGTLTCRGTYDVWYEWTATVDGSVGVNLSNLSAGVGTSTDTNHSVYINSAPGSCPTDADQVACIDPATGSFTAVSGTSYLIRIGMWSTTTTSQAMGDLTIATPTPEVCDDGVDNDFDGDTDCADADCAADPACAPPANDDCSGALTLVENVPSSFSLVNASDDGTLTCRGTDDVWFEWTSTIDASVSVDLTNLASGVGFSTDTNHSVYLNSTPGSCPTDADEIACSDPTSLNFTAVSGQSYLIRIGMWSTSGTSQCMGDVTVLTPAVEICDDGIDNDFDGDTDCADADCAAEPACAAPANDNCVDAQAVGEGSFPFSNVNASLDGPNDADGNMDADVWFLYTATVNGTATIETCGTLGTLDDSVLIVYDGAACPIAGDADLANDDDGCTTPNFSSTVAIPVEAGQSFLVQVGGWNGAQGTSDLLIEVNPPANDNCLDAEPVGEGQFPANNLGATLDGPIDGDANMDADVWFLYTAGGDGNAVIETCGSTGSLDDTVLIVYDGALGCPIAGDTGVASDDDGCTTPDFSSTVTLPVLTGETYLIQLGGWNGAQGDTTLSISLPEVCDDGIDNDADGDIDCFDADCLMEAPCMEAGNCGDGIDNDMDGLTDCDDTDCDGTPECAPITNDDCANAIAVIEGDTIANNVGATTDGPLDCDGNMSKDVWFLYTASGSGTATIGLCNTPGSLTDAVLTVYDGLAGCPVAGDAGLACDDDTCSPLGGGSAFLPQTDIAVNAGDSYYIQVGSWNDGDEGAFTLSIDLEITGDECTTAFPVGEGSFPFDNTGFTDSDVNDCDTNMSTDVWFLYTATVTGDATIDTCSDGTLTDTVIIVYDGAACPVPGDLGIACDDDTCAGPGGGSAFLSEVTIPVVAGESYYIQVGGWNGSEGDNTLTIDTVLPCVDPTPSFSADPVSGIAPLTVDFTNTSDDGGDAATTYSWDFGDGNGSTDVDPSNTYADCGTFDVTLTADGCGASVSVTETGLIQVFAMGDVNGDCLVDIADPQALANFLFGGGSAPVCGNAANVNGDGATDLGDVVYLLNFLFSGGAALVPNGPGC